METVGTVSRVGAHEMFAGSPQTGLVELILPTPDQTAFLRACLLSAEAGREAWNDCIERARDPAALGVDRWGIGVLAALFLAAVKRNHLQLATAGMTYLRTAYVNEKLRWESFCGIVADAVEVLGSHEIPVVLRGEAGLAGRLHDDPILRHAHRVDLVVGEKDKDRAAKALLSAGFSPAPPLDPTRGVLLFRHRSGLPLGLHADGSEWHDGRRHVWERCRPYGANGATALVLSPADSLVHACLSAAPGSDGESLIWVADAWNLLERCPDLDWDVVLDYAKDKERALRLAVTLEYLEREFSAPVPSGCLQTLKAAASAAEGSGVKVALERILAEKRVDWHILTHMTGDWRVRIFVLRCNLLSLPGCRGPHLQWPRWWNVALVPYRLLGYTVWYLRMRRRGHREARILETYLFVLEDSDPSC